MSSLRVRAFNADGEPLDPTACKYGRPPNIYLTDLERNPLPIQPASAGGCAVFSGVSQPVVVVMRMNVPGFGALYCVADNDGKGYSAPVEVNFNLEAAKSRLFAVEQYVKKAEADGFTISDAIKKRLKTARDRLGKAVPKLGNPREAVPLIMASLAQSLWVGEEAALERAKQQIRRNGPRKDLLFGSIFFHTSDIGTPVVERFAKLFNFATLPFYWHGDDWSRPPMWAISHLNDGSYRMPFPKAGEEGDGYSSRVHKQPAAEEWCGIDLGKEAVVAKVVLIPRPDRGFPQDFKLQVSQDGKAWHTVKEFEDYPEPKGSTPQVFPLGERRARYVRLLATKLRTDETKGRYLLQLMEFEVYDQAGRNIALAGRGARAIASSCASQGKLERIDKLLDWCLAHKITPKGHPIVYGTSSLNRLAGKPFAEQLEAVRRHTRLVVGRYKGRIDIFDVINEAHDWSVNLKRYDHKQLLELTRVVTEETKRANPHALTIVNCCLPWGAYVPVRSRKAGRPVWYPYTYLKDCIAAGIPFDVIGLQLYYDNGGNEAFDLFEYERLLDKYARLGRPIHITELGVSSQDTPDPYAACHRLSRCHWHGPWSERIQADWVDQFYTIAASKPYVQAITYWDFSERHYEKLRQWWPHGGLLRPDMTPKEAYHRLLTLIRSIRGN